MGKKKTRKSRTSAGVIGSPSKAPKLQGMKRLLNQQDAWLKGKKVVLTIRNPNGDTSKPFIKVDSHLVWGLPPILRKKNTA